MMMPNSKLILKLTLILLGLLWFTGIHFVLVSCSTGYKETVDKTKKTVTKTTQKFARKIRFSDDDLQRMAAVIGFENKSLYHSLDFTQLFRKGIPEYLNNECDDVTVANPDAGQDMESFKELNPDAGQDMESFKELPLLPSGQVDNFALAIIGRELGLSAIVTGSLDDVGMLDELRGMVWKDTMSVCWMSCGVWSGKIAII
jgi:hypothetical protein